MKIFFLVILTSLGSLLNKKVDKTLKKHYGDSVILVESQTNVPNGTMFEIAGKSDKVYVGFSPSKFDNFDYLVLFDCDNKIKLVKVLIYRENYGSEISSKRWLKQFIGLTEPKPFVDAISGATISVNSMKYSINKLIKSL